MFSCKLDYSIHLELQLIAMNLNGLYLIKFLKSFASFANKAVPTMLYISSYDHAAVQTQKMPQSRACFLLSECNSHRLPEVLKGKQGSGMHPFPCPGVAR